ncbi:MAG: helix-turn-helix transcriptional regulator [Sphaerochaetaceae bacterium]|nr:helix-turn-helix transcriptional regulator [Sphaerochaetaceae bacterium]
MTMRQALRNMRSELGLTQVELAEALNVGFSAVNRWENRGTRPNRATSIAILDLARRMHLSACCLDTLSSMLLSSRVQGKIDKEKLEKRPVFTSDQITQVLDNLDIAIIGLRIFSSSERKADIFYCNRKYSQVFGYEEKEYIARSDESPLFALTKDSRDLYFDRMDKLLEGRIPIEGFSLELQATGKSGRVLCISVKALSMNRYSFGYELLISCQDISRCL